VFAVGIERPQSRQLKRRCKRVWSASWLEAEDAECEKERDREICDEVTALVKGLTARREKKT